MRVAVIGGGMIGGTIGERWEAAGHDVVYGLRDPSKKSGAATIDEALKGADAILLAVPGSAVKQLAQDHAKGLDGKIVIDATNNFAGASNHQWDVLAAACPKAHLNRVFNTYGFDVYANPDLGGSQPDMFYAGPEGSTATVEALIKDVGLNPIWVGGVEAVDTVDGVLKLWFALSRRLGRRIAFKLISD
jgi:8-hydroxy-5-deazaflavin:NADPH oxidoreductase